MAKVGETSAAHSLMELNFTRSGPFPETPWTQVRLSGGGDTLADASREAICRMYWAPLYAFGRRNGLGPAEAEDVTQSFFAQLLRGDRFQDADREKGRMRTYLLSSLKNFISNWRRAEMTAKRGGQLQRVEFDTGEIEAVCARQSDGLSPEAFFERRWAVALLENAFKELEAEFTRSGKEQQFAVLSEFLMNHGKEAQHGLAAQQLGLSEASTRVMVHRLRKRYRDLVRRHVEATVGAAEEVDDELRHLMSLYAA